MSADYDLDSFVTLTRFKVLEALLSAWTERGLTRAEARLRLELLKSSPEVRAAALAWFDIRWPKEGT